jgi:hypothetical protein
VAQARTSATPIDSKQAFEPNLNPGAAAGNAAASAHSPAVYAVDLTNEQVREQTEKQIVETVLGKDITGAAASAHSPGVYAVDLTNEQVRENKTWKESLKTKRKTKPNPKL